MNAGPSAAARADHERLSWEAWLALFLLALTVLRLLALACNRTDLFFDEAQYWTWAQVPAFGYFSKPPLIAWLIWLTTSLFGNSEAAVRLSSPLLYAGAGIFIFLAGRTLYDARTGFIAAVVFTTLPGVSFSSNIVSTDVPLLFFWSAALYFLLRVVDTRSWTAALFCGLAIGLGLLAKYAMLYFYLCALVWFLIEPRARFLLRDWKGAVLLVLPLAILAPNLLWNAKDGFVTFHHTAANADLSGSLLHPLNLLSFLGAQFGVFGPILFPMLIWIAVRAARTGTCAEDRMLFAFSLPILLLIAVIAFLSRAHANWAATAYPAAAILVVATMLRLDRWRLLVTTLAINAVALIVLAIAPAIAGTRFWPARNDPFDRTLGWHETADLVRKGVAATGAGSILTEDRGLTAELLYYLRDDNVPIRVWRRAGPPRDHYELTIPYRADTPEPILLAALKPSPHEITAQFSTAGPGMTTPIDVNGKIVRRLTLRTLRGPKTSAVGPQPSSGHAR